MLTQCEGYNFGLEIKARKNDKILFGNDWPLDIGRFFCTTTSGLFQSESTRSYKKMV